MTIPSPPYEVLSSLQTGRSVDTHANVDTESVCYQQIPVLMDGLYDIGTYHFIQSLMLPLLEAWVLIWTTLLLAWISSGIK